MGGKAGPEAGGVRGAAAGCPPLCEYNPPHHLAAFAAPSPASTGTDNDYRVTAAAALTVTAAAMADADPKKKLAVAAAADAVMSAKVAQTISFKKKKEGGKAGPETGGVRGRRCDLPATRACCCAITPDLPCLASFLVSSQP